ncbi:hypothetical protein E4U32_001280, partial [Claviceps aff. humidiphila group G2b]
MCDVRCATPVAALCGFLASLGSSRASRTRHMVCHMVFEGPLKWSNTESGERRPSCNASNNARIKASRPLR